MVNHRLQEDRSCPGETSPDNDDGTHPGRALERSGLATVKVCSNCGQGNDDDALFCASCNHFLEWTEVARLVPKEPIREGGAPGEPGTAPTAGPERQPPLPSTFPVRGEAGERADRPAGTGRQHRPPAGVDGRSRPAPAVPAHPGPLRTTPAAARDSPHPQPGPAENLERSRQVAAARGRTDLVEQIDQTRHRLAARPVSVVVVGEFKKGKSTLVNAMLQTAVCPADADLVTVVPTIVRFGEKAEAYAYLEPAEGAEPERIEVPLDQIADFSSEQGNPANRRHLRSVEVLLGHRMLRTGLSLVDTPWGRRPRIGARHHHLVGARPRRRPAVRHRRVHRTDRARGGVPAASDAAVPDRGVRGDEDRSLSGVAADRRVGPWAPRPGRHRNSGDRGLVVPAAGRPAGCRH